MRLAHRDHQPRRARGSRRRACPVTCNDSVSLANASTRASERHAGDSACASAAHSASVSVSARALRIDARQLRTPTRRDRRASALERAPQHLAPGREAGAHELEHAARDRRPRPAASRAAAAARARCRPSACGTNTLGGTVPDHVGRARSTRPSPTPRRRPSCPGPRRAAPPPRAAPSRGSARSSARSRARATTTGVATLYGRFDTMIHAFVIGEQRGPVDLERVGHARRRRPARARPPPAPPRAGGRARPRSTCAPASAQRERQRTEAGPDLDHAVAGLHAREPHDVRGHVGVGEEVLTERLARPDPVRARAAPGSRSASPLDAEDPRRVRARQLGDLVRRRRRAPRPARRRRATTNAGSFGLPRCGSGARYGLSVSTSTRSAGASAAAARSVVGGLERDDAAERQVAIAVERGARFVGTAGEAVEDRALGHAFVVEHAERVVPRVARVDHQRPVHASSRAGSGTGTRPPARRAASARRRGRSRLADRDARARRRASGSSASHSSSSLRRVVRMQADRRVHVVGCAIGERRAPACDVSRSVPTHTIHSTPAARARSTCASASATSNRVSPSSSCRWQCASTQAVTRPLSAGTAASPFSSFAPAGKQPPRRRGRHPLVFGPAGQTEPAPQLGRRVRDHRRREQRDDAQRLEAVTEHARDRVRVARLVERPRRASPR